MPDCSEDWAGCVCHWRWRRSCRGTFEEALAEVRARGLEGLIAKRRGSHYRGIRSSDWLKLKVLQSQEVAIVGFTPITTRQPAIGALLLGVRTGTGYVYAGKVGTGFDDAERARLFRQLSGEVTSTPSVVDAPRSKTSHWVQPRLVAQVAFTEWTRDGRLRHPIYKGLREDKRPEDTRRERPEVQ